MSDFSAIMRPAYILVILPLTVISAVLTIWWLRIWLSIAQDRRWKAALITAAIFSLLLLVSGAILFPMVKTAAFASVVNRSTFWRFLYGINSLVLNPAVHVSAVIMGFAVLKSVRANSVWPMSAKRILGLALAGVIIAIVLFVVLASLIAFLIVRIMVPS